MDDINTGTANGRFLEKFIKELEKQGNPFKFHITTSCATTENWATINEIIKNFYTNSTITIDLRKDGSIGVSAYIPSNKKMLEGFLI